MFGGTIGATGHKQRAAVYQSLHLLAEAVRGGHHHPDVGKSTVFLLPRVYTYIGRNHLSRTETDKHGQHTNRGIDRVVEISILSLREISRLQSETCALATHMRCFACDSRFRPLGVKKKNSGKNTTGKCHPTTPDPRSHVALFPMWPPNADLIILRGTVKASAFYQNALLATPCLGISPL